MHRLLAGLFVLMLVAGSCSSDDTDAPPSAEAETTSTAASGPESQPDQDAIDVVTLNLLHGLFCPEETDACQAPDRVAIFADRVDEADCPDLIGLQEIGPRLEELIPPALETLCDGEYTIAWEAVDSPDRGMILSRLPILDEGFLDIANFPWEAYWVRVDAPLGPVDFLTTHFASSANNPDCLPDQCPPICPPGIATNECHAIEVVDFFEQRPGDAVMEIVGGDLNAAPDSQTVTTLTDASFDDAWLSSGQPECDPATHLGCTGGGGQPEPFVGIDTEEGPGFDSRIDYLLVRPGEGCEPDIETAGFAHEPRPSPQNGLYWPSDHAGVAATLGCG